MRKVGSAMANFLDSNATFLGEAWIGGYLYDMGEYPGLIYRPAALERVWGEVFVLDNPVSVLGVLDGYEGVFGKESDEYRRSLLTVFTENGWQPCWVYEWALSYQDFPLIPEGRYEHYFGQKEAHRRFVQS